MRLVFSGAVHEVTGSKHYLEAAGKKVLVDCGMEQGKDLFENRDIPAAASQVDYVLLTHAHIDHSGLIPLLYAQGFRGPVYCTEATMELCDIMLKDSAHIQEAEAEWKNRKGKRAGHGAVEPLYTTEQAAAVMEQFIPCQYDQIIQVCDGISIRFIDAGHLLGSASIEVWATEGEVTKKLVFSGDIGNINQPIIDDPNYITEADYVIMESTYGDRVHGERPDYVGDLGEVIQRTLDRGGNVVIPSFAVGRTQEILYFIREIKERGLVQGHDGFEVYVDSPLAVEATTIFDRNIPGCYDDEAKALIRQGISPIKFEGLKVSISSNDSIAINTDMTPKVIISASGMCDAGRIRHHLKHNLWRPESTVLFVGYQSVGTLGRNLVDGATEVKLFGEEIAVKAEIATLIGISGHADSEGLMKWIGAFEKKPQRVFIVHGEDGVTDILAERIRKETGLDAVAPYTGWEYDLITNECLAAPQAVRIVKPGISAAARKVSEVFQRLEAAGKRLLSVIAHNEHGANSDLEKFTDEINRLCDKWDR
ncbi:MAG: MBL fold metallo-hydrolase [Lachnospiraceae bacterium]|nr:MBL fold metallo-hydrolase [Lachnospiraceae bacterium]